MATGCSDSDNSSVVTTQTVNQSVATGSILFEPVLAAHPATPSVPDVVTDLQFTALDAQGAVVRIGKLARSTGISVRTLHHYEEVGLLRPPSRTAAGHRVYTLDDLKRLQQIVSLRDLGLSLAEIGLCLDVDRTSLRGVLEAHRRAVGERIEHYQRVSQRIDSTLDLLALGRVDAVTLVKGMCEMNGDVEFTERRRARAAEVGLELFTAAIGENKRIMGEVAACRDRDLPPDDPELMELARRSREIREFLTGGDPVLAAQWRRWNDETWHRNRQSTDPELMAYLDRSKALL